MKTIKVQYHHADSGNCQTTFKEVDKPRYFNMSDGGGWYTCTPSGNYWGNGCLVADDVAFIIVDANKNPVTDYKGHCFVNSKETPILSVARMAKAVAREMAEEYQLKAWNDWKQYVMSDYRQGFNYDGYSENWPFEADDTEKKVLKEFSHLGLRFAIVAYHRVHKISQKQWVQYDVVRLGRFEICEEICGFKF